MADTCEWVCDEPEEHSGSYSTECGKYFSIEDGTIEEFRMKFCTFCGKKTIAVYPELDEEEENE